MSLSLDEIYALLAGKQPVVLTGGVFQEMTDTLGYLNAVELQILKDAPPVKSSGKVTLDGKSDVLGVKGVATHLEVTGDGTHQVTLAFSLPASWQFTTSFSNLPLSYKPVDDTPGLSSLQPSILGDLHFSNPTIVVQSAAGGGRAAGLTFTGDLTENTAFKNLAGPLQLGATPTVSGTLTTLGEKAPDVRLSVAAGLPALKVGSWLEVTGVGVKLFTTPAPTDESTEITLVEVSGTVRIGKTDPVLVEINSPIYGSSSIFAFAAELPPDTVSIKRGIDALIELAHGNPDEFALPEGITLVESLSLREISTIVDPTVPNVRHLQFAVESSQTWKISERIHVTELGFGWLVLFPFDPELRSVSASIHGQLRLGSGNDAVRFDLEAHSHGGFSASGALHEGDTVNLTRLVALALGRPADGLPEWDLTKLSLTFDTSSHKLTFEAASTLEIVKDQTATISLDVQLTKPNGSYEATIKGQLVVAGQIFEAEFDADGTSKRVRFTWTDRGRPLGFEDLATLFGYTMAPLPEQLDLTLVKAAFSYDFTAKTVVVSAQSKTGRQILFASAVPPKPPDSPRLYLFELDVPLNLELKNLPVIGDKLPPGLQFGIERLQVIVASAAIPDLAMLKAVIAGGGGQAGLIPATLTKGLTFAAMLRAGTGTLPIVVPLSEGAPPKLAATERGSGPNYQAAAIWFPVAKTFGPVSLDRVGLQYEDSRVFFLIDASLGFSAFELEMNGLGVGSPLSEVKLVPHLDGMSVGFSSGPITINGGLLRVPPADLPKTPPPNDVAFEYIGAVTIAVEPYLIGGMASYAKVGDRSSFFLFAQVTGQFGGPPAFFITGFMGGFGFNSALTLPAPGEIRTFPFLAGLDDPTVFGTDKPQPLDVMTALAGGAGRTPWVVPAAGEAWIAGGIRFRSFEIVDGRALLVVKLGHQFAVALYGLATLSLPQGKTEEAYAYVELQIEAVFKPNEGFFGIDGSLTPNSYLLMRDCHLTGGFAFWTWFAADDPSTLERAGDFVVSVGGYHPAFVPPKYYPTLARVGFNWPVSAEVTLKGGVYMALTPTAIMAGGNLEAVYQSGNLRAWFTADANLMIRWKPFYFTATIGISLGASYRLTLGSLSTTLSVELGASLELWGPPTGGTVHVHWFILSFTVPFGATQKDGEALELDWSGFTALLPSRPVPHVPKPLQMAADNAPQPAVLGVQLNRGLIRADEPSGTWFVRADELVFTTESAVPLTSIEIDGAAVDLRHRSIDPPKTIAIRPMNVTGVTSSHTITVTRLGEKEPLHIDWAPVVQRRNLPEALWGAPIGKDNPRPTANTIPGLPVGVMLTAPPAKEGHSPGVMNIAGIIAPLAGGAMPLKPPLQSDGGRAALEEESTPTGLAAGQMQLFDDFRPGLDDGTYQIEVAQAVTAPGATFAPVKRLFTIAGPRFALDPSDVHAQFPPNGVSGQFDRTLPQIVLTKRRLPWERKVVGIDERTPWLALLVFEPGELLDFKLDGEPTDPDAAAKHVIANGAQTMTVQQALEAKGVRVPHVDPKTLSPDDLRMKCQAIRIGKDTFVRIVPTATELRSLVHVRKVNTGDKVSLGLKDAGTFSVVAANRFPAAGTGAHGARNIVHLVSLEGFGELLGETRAGPAEATVQLVSLASWTFTCLEDAAQTFAGLVHTLARDGDTPRLGESLLLRVPSTGSQEPAVRARLDAGYVELGHRARDGRDGTAWFRGPLSPVVVERIKKDAPFTRAAEAVREDAQTGTADLSLATAWQIGRSLALADQAFAMALMRLRKKAHGVLGRMTTAGMPHDRLTDVARLFAGGLATAVLNASKSDQLRPVVRAGDARAATTRRRAEQLRTLAAAPSFHAALADEMHDDADAAAVAEWVGRLQILTGVPFVHLVPDVLMLPPATIRFFYVDPNWISAMTDGALSLGITTGHEVATHAAIVGGLGRTVDSAPAPASGLLLRSPVVSGFPGLQVSGRLSGAPVAPLRIDHLGSDVLLCLFKSVPDTVTLAKPQEGIELGVDDEGQVTVRTVKQGNIITGDKLTVFDPRTPGASGNIVRPGGQRVLDVLRLVGTLEKSAGAGAAAFALPLLRGAEQIEFS